MGSEGEFTQLLAAASDGDRRAVDRLLPLVYDELRAMAAEMMNRERPGHTLQPTALVHEAYLKLVDQKEARWRSRAHFFAVAAVALRRILVDHARARGRAKRGGGEPKLPLDERLAAAYERAVDLVALDEALEGLAASHPRHARVVELRFFGGLTIDETAQLLGVSPSTVEREWRYARARLFRALSGGGATHNMEPPSHV